MYFILKPNYISEEHVATIFRVKEITKQETPLIRQQTYATNGLVGATV
jgi:hypothetical protein